jgi:hypothetical protein
VVSALCCLELARHLVTLPSRGVALGHGLIPLPPHRLELGRDPIASRIRLLTLVRHLTQLAADLIQALRSPFLLSFEVIKLTA